MWFYPHACLPPTCTHTRCKYMLSEVKGTFQPKPCRPYRIVAFCTCSGGHSFVSMPSHHSSFAVAPTLSLVLP